LTRARHIAGPARQRGWVGLVVLLLAIAIVGYLAKDALKQYGLMSTTPAARKTEGARMPAADAPNIATPSYAAPIERARGVEDTINRAAQERERKMP
jgi:hypothetical protein